MSGSSDSKPAFPGSPDTRLPPLPSHRATDWQRGPSKGCPSGSWVPGSSQSAARNHPRPRGGQRNEKASVDALYQMYVQDVSTRKVKKVTEKLCGHSFSPSAISRINKKLDAELEAFAKWRPEEDYP